MEPTSELSDIVRQKTVSWQDPMATATIGRTMSGRHFLEAIRNGDLPAPPIAILMGFSIEEVGEGWVTFACTPDESLYNPIGVVHGGLVSTLADTVIGCAVHSLLDPGVAYTSIDLTVSYLRPVVADGTKLLATGTVTKPGRRVAFASAEIVDTNGKVVATGSGSVLIMDTRS
ncbi:MAG: PaaI family thioesterase [Acidimicrobiales bacterium]